MAELPGVAEIVRLAERLDILIPRFEKMNETINNTNLIVERLKTNYENLDRKVNVIATDVQNLQSQPGKKWDTLVAAIIATAVSVFIGIIVKIYVT